MSAYIIPISIAAYDTLSEVAFPVITVLPLLYATAPVALGLCYGT